MRSTALMFNLRRSFAPWSSWIYVVLSFGCGAISLAGTRAPAQSPVPPGPLAPAKIGSADAKRSTSLPAQLSPYRITGSVIDAVSKSPIPNVRLSIEPMNSAKQSRAARRHSEDQLNSAVTDLEGHFDLKAASAGGWSLTAEAKGYRTQPLDEHDGYSTAVVLTETAPTFNVTFPLTPASAIEGFVLDEAGEAVRGASVALVYLPPSIPDTEARRPRPGAQQMTDDRGFYKFYSLRSGSYEVRVTATPWYAKAASRSSPTLDSGERAVATTLPDPLDAVYPVVWFPGVTDPLTATPILLRGGETQEANFRLLPMPSSHLHIAGLGRPSSSGADSDPRSQAPIAFLTRVLPDGTEDPQQTPSRTDAHGNTDIGGLAPGTYLVHQQTLLTGVQSLTMIQIGAGSPQTMDLSEGTPAATVTVQVDPSADLDGLQVTFRELETGHAFYAQRLGDLGRRQTRGQLWSQTRGQNLGLNLGQGRSPDDSPAPEPHSSKTDRTVSLPPGQYEVLLEGIGDLHLTSIEATGASAAGRIVTIGKGNANVFLHTAKGVGIVTGTVRLQGLPLSGAMIMLIPATFGNPSGLDRLARDQSNTDGSFELGDLLPGGYILVAVNNGWDVNWSDPSTLRRYLVRGQPVEIKPGSDLKLAIEAQAP